MLSIWNILVTKRLKTHRLIQTNLLMDELLFPYPQALVLLIYFWNRVTNYYKSLIAVYKFRIFSLINTVNDVFLTKNFSKKKVCGRFYLTVTISYKQKLFL